VNWSAGGGLSDSSISPEETEALAGQRRNQERRSEVRQELPDLVRYIPVSSEITHVEGEKAANPMHSHRGDKASVMGVPARRWFSLKWREGALR